jgi:K+-transporting ATPase ATPase A chain
MPLCVLGAMVLVWQGVPDNFSAYTHAKTLDGAEQIIAQGPVASQEIIKELGTNGGGFFNANSAHPFEKSHASHQPDRDAGNLCDRRKPDAYVRRDGR